MATDHLETSSVRVDGDKLVISVSTKQVVSFDTQIYTDFTVGASAIASKLTPEVWDEIQKQCLNAKRVAQRVNPEV